MKLGLLALGIVALLVGLLFSFIWWGQYSKSSNSWLEIEASSIQLSQQKETLTRTEYEYRSRELSGLMASCEEIRVGDRNLLISFSSVAGIGLVLVISSFFVGRKEEPEQTRFIT